MNKSNNARIAELEARLKEAEARIEQWVAQAKRADRAIADLEAENERLLDVEADAGRLRAALEKVEWDNEWGDCLWCNQNKHKGHVPTCARQAALRPAATGEEREK